MLYFALVAMAIGVYIASWPSIAETLTSARPLDRADWLGLGIFCAWVGTFVNRFWSIVWYYLGQPEWLLESDTLGYALWLRMCAAVFHLAAPGAIDEQVPPRRWINIGILVSMQDRPEDSDKWVRAPRSIAALRCHEALGDR